MTDQPTGFAEGGDDPADDTSTAVERVSRLLQDEYPDEMARRVCTCEPDAMCGAHRLLARYSQLHEALTKANQDKREQRRLRYEAEEALAECASRVTREPAMTDQPTGFAEGGYDEVELSAIQRLSKLLRGLGVGHWTIIDAVEALTEQPDLLIDLAIEAGGLREECRTCGGDESCRFMSGGRVGCVPIYHRTFEGEPS